MTTENKKESEYKDFEGTAGEWKVALKEMAQKRAEKYSENNKENNKEVA